MALTAVEQVRLKLGERIPDGGSAADTLFSDEEVQLFLDQGVGNVDAASYYGWLAKAAEYANLVNTSEGNSARTMSDLHQHALNQAKLYEGAAGSVSGGNRVRIRPLVRKGGGIE
jgi:hypothetical protein